MTVTANEARESAFRSAFVVLLVHAMHAADTEAAGEVAADRFVVRYGRLVHAVRLIRRPAKA